MVVYLRKARITLGLREGSIVLDAQRVLGLLRAFVVHPPPRYLGIDRVGGLGLADFGVLPAGIRLSRRAAVTAFFLFTAGVAGLMVLDVQRNGVADDAANRVAVFVLLIHAGVIAWLIAGRTRTLVLEGASQ